MNAHMYTKNHNLEEINESDVKNDSIWTQTPLRDFSSKCIMTEHNLCHDSKCKCLCHQKKES
jgi:hypothetical protein